jgi:hypothetical protein
MRESNTDNVQDVMGSNVGTLKRVHTREMSRLFKSKKDVY